MRPTLFEFAGGDAAFVALAAAHHARCLRDPELNHPFSHPDQHPEHVERLAAYWAEVMGGPPRYTSRAVTNRESCTCTQATETWEIWGGLCRVLRPRGRRRRTSRESRIPSRATGLHGVGSRRRAVLLAARRRSSDGRSNAALVVGRPANPDSVDQRIAQLECRAWPAPRLSPLTKIPARFGT